MWARRGTCIQVYGILKDARARRRRKREKASKQGAQGPSGVGVFGGLLASRSPFGGSWRSPTGVQRALPTLRSQNLLPPKLDPLQFCWAWLDQARPFLNYCLFLFAKIPLLGSGVISKAQLLQGINVWHSCLGHFFSSLELRSQLGSYLSFLVHGHIILACKKYTKKCVNSWQNSQSWPK